MTRKPDFPEQERAVEAVAAAARDYVSIDSAQRPSYSDFLEERDLFRADSYARHGYMPVEKSPELAEMNLDSLHALLEVAGRDTENLYTGIHQYLQSQGFADAEILQIAQRSRPLGRTFGSIVPTKSRDLALSAMRGEAVFKMGLDGEQLPVIEFSDGAKDRYIKAYRGRGIGCPVIAMTVECPYSRQKVNLYDIHWEAFCEQAHLYLIAPPGLDMAE